MSSVRGGRAATATRITATTLAIGVGLLAWACTNNPYPDEDSEEKILYGVFSDAPKTLDPVKAYTTNATRINGNVYDTLLEYHFLKRPYTLIPGLATDVPVAEPLEDGRVAYTFKIRPGALYQDDPCFELDEPGRLTRAVTAGDVAFELARIADPRLNSPVISPFSNIDGVPEFYARLKELEDAEEGFETLSARERYALAGPIAGVQVVSETELRIVLREPYPQILYWFAMPFSAPMPWEAVEYYDGNEGRPHLADHPVGAGPYKIAHYDKQFRIVLEKNENWYGVQHPEWKAPGATYPSEGTPEDAATGRLDPAYVGKPLPFIDRIEFRREKESIPLFNKFLQGYYDASTVIKESFDTVIVEDGLSDDMAERGIKLEKMVQPSVFYISFNMEDPVVGHPGGERSRKLRQAMSLAIDTEQFLNVFYNGRGVPAQSPLPPGLFGYDEDYFNPYRELNLERAKKLLSEAGYEHGIDPDTGKPLRLSFDTADTSAAGLVQDTFIVDSWRKIGLDVRVAATNYNQFQEKVRKGSYQVFEWGWIADYPDPENFLFLLWSEMRRSVNEGPNSANYSNPRFDELFLAMKARDNDAERLRIIREMVQILEEDRPWIETFHREDYALYQPWLKNLKPTGLSFPTVKYRDIDPQERARLRADWNEPVRWPAYGLAAAVVALIAPGFVTFFRERQ